MVVLQRLAVLPVVLGEVAEVLGEFFFDEGGAY